MSGMTGILGDWPWHFAAAALIVMLCAACGSLDSNIPSDGEMIEVFKTKEKTFSEIVELFQEFPSWEGHHPREQVYHNGYWPEVAESRSFFCEERASRIDSLLQVIGCENVHFRYSYSYYLILLKTSARLNILSLTMPVDFLSVRQLDGRLSTVPTLTIQRQLQAR